VDPAAQAPVGYDESQRGVPGGFVGDPDVLDTWATSSLTPQIVGGWGVDPQRWANVFPFDLRPQGHDIIRTWLFSTVVRANSLEGKTPWKHAALSGWILDPDRKKMSKSKGNVVVPTDILEKFGADAVRYWAASAKLGADTAYEISQMKIGRRLAIKVLNASKFALNMGVTAADVLSTPSDAAVVVNGLDASLLARLADVVEQATKAFDAYDYARALDLTESFFWSFTDDYVELIKDRAYGGVSEEETASVRATLATTLDAVLRLLAPFQPFATDEVWGWWRAGSVHRAAWPSAAALRAGLPASADAGVLPTVGEALAGLRKAKSEAKVKQRTPVVRATVSAPADAVARLSEGLGDLKAATAAEEITLVEAGEQLVVSDVELGEVAEA
jgi:valyl-tRNA synthetase